MEQTKQVLEDPEAQIKRKRKNKMNKKSLITSALIAAGIVSSASAVNVVYITGSTAFRANVNNALASNAGPGAGGVFDAGTVDSIATYGSTASSKATYALYHGKIGGAETYVDVFWTGSEAGFAADARRTDGATLNDGSPLAGVPTTFLVPSTVNNPNGNSSSLPSSSSTPAQLNASPSFPDLNMGDNSQAVSLTKPGINGDPLTDFGICGIIPFVWVKGVINSADGAWGRFSNLSHAQANALLLNGSRTADFINSGVAGSFNDFDHSVFLVGRNKGSGTRVNYLLDSGLTPSTPVFQYQVCSVTGVNPATGLTGLYYVGIDGTHYAAYSFGSIPHTVGDGNDADNGYESGGDVAKALALVGPAGATFNGQKVLTVGFLGVSDAGGLPTGNRLTLDGVAESDGAIENGTYTAWGHEHIYGHTPATTFVANTFVPALFGGIKHDFQNNDTAPGADDNALADPSTLHSTGILGAYMFADRANKADAGFPVYGAATGYTYDNVNGQ